MEEYREYKGRRNPQSKKKSSKKHYLKKLLKQSIFSLLIFTSIFTLGLSKNELASKITLATKSALNQEIDFRKVREVLGNFLDKSIPALRQGEIDNEINETHEQNL